MKFKSARQRQAVMVAVRGTGNFKPQLFKFNARKDATQFQKQVKKYGFETAITTNGLKKRLTK